MHPIVHDAVVAMRRLRHNRFFTAGVIAVLALAIGAATAIFTVVHAIVLRPLAVAEPERLVAFFIARPDTDRGPVSLPNLQDYRAGTQSLAAIEACFQWSANVTGDGDAERLQGMRVTPGYFDVLGGSAAIGRVFTAADTEFGTRRIALISHGLWKRRFGGASDVLGSTVVLNGDAFTIVGVLRPDFPFQIRDAEIVAPFPPATDPRRDNRAMGFLRVVARLRPGVTLMQAKADLDGITARLRAQYPATNGTDTGVRIAGLQTEIVGESDRLLGLLFGAVCLVLLVACANLANLMLVREAAIRRDLALRSALGASRLRLLQQLAIEAVLLTSAGAIPGIAIAWIGVSVLLAISPAMMPRASEVTLDATSLVFAGAVALVAALLFGLLPAVQLSRHTERSDIRSFDRSVTSDARRLRSIFVAVEVALAVVLVFAAGLLARSLIRLQRIDPGFDSSGVLTIRLSLPRGRYQSTHDIDGFVAQLGPRLSALPGVRAVAAANVVPLNGYLATADFLIEGEPPPRNGHRAEVHYRMVSPEYLEALRIPLLEGRRLDDHDRAGAAAVAVINEAMAERHFRDRSPLGARLLLYDETPARPRPVEIVGVCGNVRHFGLHRDPVPEIYVPIPQVPDATSIWLGNNMYWLVASRDGEPPLAAAIRHELRAVDAQVPASFIRTMDDWLEASMASRRFNLRLVVFFAVSALVLAAIGVYAVASAAAALRVREMGIRTALGATPLEITRLVLIGGLTPVLCGLAGGIAASLAAGPLLANLLFDTAPRDPGVLLAVVAALGAAGVTAAAIPAQRAQRINPVVALRME
jgi:putative ABC transport system permease protein